MSTLKNKINSLLPLVISFTGGFHIMSIEMCAFRSLQTNFGASIYVTGILLTLVMTALAIGYFYGGRKADVDSIHLISIILLCVSTYAVIMGILGEQLIFDFTFALRDHFSDIRLTSSVR